VHTSAGKDHGSTPPASPTGGSWNSDLILYPPFSQRFRGPQVLLPLNVICPVITVVGIESLNGQVGHQVLGCYSVPMPCTSWSHDTVASPDDVDKTAPATWVNPTPSVTISRDAREAREPVPADAAGASMSCTSRPIPTDST
jgi:hypothetical protein